MVNIFPPGFWRGVVMIGMTLFFVLGVDLVLGARLVIFLSRTMNRKFLYDQFIVKALSDLKKGSDKEFDVEHSMMYGWGRIVMGGLLLFGGALILMSLLPRLK